MYDAFMSESALMNLMATLYKQVYPQNNSTASYHHSVRRAIDLMKKQTDSTLTIDDLAAHCGYSPKHFQKVFKDATGVTPHQFYINEKIERAKYLLIHTAIPIKLVAVNCGFFNVSHFIKTFQKHVGITPQKFRVNNK